MNCSFLEEIFQINSANEVAPFIEVTRQQEPLTFSAEWKHPEAPAWIGAKRAKH